MQQQIPRIVMIGDASVGKTSLVYRLCRNSWNENTKTSVSASFYTLKKEESGDSQEIQIWDTAGSEKYRAVNSVYYHNAMGGILVFDLTDRKSFESLDGWVNEFLGLAQPTAILTIVGNKLDKLTDPVDPIDEDSIVKPEEAEKWAALHRYQYFSTSARDGTNVQDLADYLLNSTLQRAVTNFPSSLNIDTKGNAEEKKGGCCA